ncbi:MAG: DEAD/DEAH box helicase [Verrucomicrobia bacterium]|nr:DEAD/DEAH box helicase [Verrucomicrobiota bacterium]
MVKRVIKSIARKLGKQKREKPERTGLRVEESKPSQTRPDSAKAQQQQPERKPEVYRPGGGKTASSKTDRPPQGESAGTGAEPREHTYSHQDDGQQKRRRPRRRGGRGRQRRNEERSEPTEQKKQDPTSWDITEFSVAPEEGKTRFHDLDLPPEIMRAVSDLKFQYCTPIQAQILPHVLKGSDAGGKAQTGTGKTAAFLIAGFAHMLKNPPKEEPKPGTPRILILAPTRELVIQIAKEADEIGKYCNAEVMPVFGGMDYAKQKNQLHGKRVDVVCATPGRLLDFRRNRDINLRHVEMLVIDEADRMLDMGFIPDVRTIVHSTPPKTHRQTMLFSATLTPEVTRLAAQWMHDAVTIEVAPDTVAVESVEQLIYITTKDEKFALLYNILQNQSPPQPMLVFTNRRDVTQDLAERLQSHGIDCAVFSGAVAQNKRLTTIEKFKSGELRVLVATDAAGRGLHIEGISHVINYNLPDNPDAYVHRIGRTGRAGASGTAVSFACETDSFHIPDIEAYIGRDLPCIHPDDNLVKPPPPPVRAIRRQPRPPSAGASSRGGRRDSRRRGPPRRS